MIQVNNHEFYENLTTDSVVKLIDQLKTGGFAAAKVGPQTKQANCEGPMGKTSLFTIHPSVCRDLDALKAALPAAGAPPAAGAAPAAAPAAAAPKPPAAPAAPKPPAATPPPPPPPPPPTPAAPKPQPAAAPRPPQQGQRKQGGKPKKN